MAAGEVIRPAGGTAAEWAADDPILKVRELGIETDTRRIKIGDGVTPWSGLDYLSVPVTWGQVTGTVSAQADLQAALDVKAPLASPALTGTPTAPTAAAGTNTTQIATTAFVTTSAVRFDTATQGLNSTQQTNARTNIAALPVANPNPTGNITFNSNNTPILRQYNAALSATVNLPYVNSGNGYTFDRDVYVSAGSVSTNPLGIQSLLTLVGTSGFTTGARMVYLNTNAVTGSVTGFESEISASTRFEGFRVRNTHASGVCGGRIIGNGNLYLDFFRETDFQRWGLRLKSDGNFTIGQTVQGSDVADALRINFTSLQTSFLYPPKLPSYTVAGLPSTTTYGVGSKAFASNGRRAGEGAGTGTGCPVWSDGTNWRTFYDNSIVAA
ncbi:hypothetical protein [Sphingomonas sp.]|uniref:hyaluronate lyase N-terminal domain-containing protein n=1 Tax=Sphingomonas sp. TaxID=28214 RepID=UPI003F6EF820